MLLYDNLYNIIISNLNLLIRCEKYRMVLMNRCDITKLTNSILSFIGYLY